MNFSSSDVLNSVPPACRETCNTFFSPLKKCLDNVKLDNNIRQHYGSISSDVVLPAAQNDVSLSILQVQNIWIYSDLASDCYCERDSQDAVHECNDCLRSHIATAFNYKDYVLACNTLSANKQKTGTGYGVSYEAAEAASKANQQVANYEATSNIPPPMFLMNTIANLIPAPTTAKNAFKSSRTFNAASAPSYAADFFDPKYHGESNAGTAGSTSIGWALMLSIIAILVIQRKCLL